MSDNNKQFDEIEWKNTLNKAGEDARDRHHKSIEKIKELAKSVDAVRLFIAVYANLGFGIAEHFDDHTYGTVPVKVELLAYHLYPYFEYSNEKQITPFLTNYCIDLIEELFLSAQQQSLFSIPDTGNHSTADHLVDSLRMYAEIVRGSAYPEQTAAEISAIQGKFEQWFADKVGIGPNRAVELLWAIIKTIEELYNVPNTKTRDYATSVRLLIEQIQLVGKHTLFGFVFNAREHL